MIGKQSGAKSNCGVNERGIVTAGINRPPFPGLVPVLCNRSIRSAHITVWSVHVCVCVCVVEGYRTCTRRSTYKQQTPASCPDPDPSPDKFTIQLFLKSQSMGVDTSDWPEPTRRWEGMGAGGSLMKGEGQLSGERLLCFSNDGLNENPAPPVLAPPWRRHLQVNKGKDAQPPSVHLPPFTRSFPAGFHFANLFEFISLQN